jgi:hypothetical protein
MDDPSPGGLTRLFAGALPHSRPERKKRKPDLEALALLPATKQAPHGALLPSAPARGRTVDGAR